MKILVEKIKEFFVDPQLVAGCIDSNSETIPVLKGLWYTQRLEVISGTIYSLGLRIATYNRINDCSLQVKLHSEKGKIFHDFVIYGRNLQDNSVFSIKFGEPLTVKGNAVYVSIKSIDGYPGNNLGLWRVKEVGSDLLIRKSTSLYGLDLKCNPPIHVLEGSGFELEIMVSSVALYYRRKKLENHQTASLNRVIVALSSDSDFNTGTILKSLVEDNSIKLEFSNSLRNFAAINPDMILVQATLPENMARHVGLSARRMGIPAVLIVEEGMAINEALKETWKYYIDYIVSATPIDRFPEDIVRVVEPKRVTKELDVLCFDYQSFLQPVVSVIFPAVDVLSCRGVIESFARQSYTGAIQLVYVGKAENQQCIEWIQNALKELACRYPRSIPIKCSYVIDHSNSYSRTWLIGTKQAEGDLIVLSDCSCMVSRNFVQTHVDAHSYKDCKAVIGPVLSQIRCDDSILELCELEQDIEECHSRSLLRDSTNIESFLNCRAGNLSVRKAEICLLENIEGMDCERFPLDWVAVVLGYKIYQNGGRIKFASEAIALKVEVEEKAIIDSGNLLSETESLAIIQEILPEFEVVTRRWKSKGIVDSTIPLNDYGRVSNLYTDANHQTKAVLTNVCNYKLRNRKLRVITYRWHVPHQYELYKLPYQFDLLTGLGSPITESWDFSQRPMPNNAKFISLADFREQDYDLAILHFDENVLSYENTNGQLGAEWGSAFRWFVENISLPKVAICHGTPQFYGQYTPGYDGDDLMSVIESARKHLVEYVKDIEVVCNSYQAQREWDFYCSRVIWHGFDPIEFPPARYEKGILSPLGGLVTSRPHYRGFYLYQQVFDEYFPREFLPSQLKVPDPHVDYIGNVFALAKYRNYINELRKYSIYFNPTLRSPMPRARAEPMMCGVVTVNANNHDVDMFIKNGLNGFYSNDPNELKEFLIYLMKNPIQLRKIGREARLTAIDVFNHDRYLSDWRKLICDVLGAVG